MTVSPCKDCPNRFIGCHSKCKKYIQFRKELDEENKRLSEIKGINEASICDNDKISTKYRIKILEHFRK